MLTIELTLQFDSPHNIGSSLQQGTLAKQPLLKNRAGWPYVPASALKGRLRHAVEQISRSLGQHVCQTHQLMCRDHAPACVVCALFGSPWHRGQAIFSDLQLSGPEYIMELRKDPDFGIPQTSLRPGVAINRRRRVAEDNMLYSTETLFPGVPLAFSGRIGEIPDEVAAARLVAGLRHLFALGRNKTRGMGWLTLLTVTVRDGETVIPDATLQQRLQEAG